MATPAHVPSLQGDGSLQQIVQMGPGEGEYSYVKNSGAESHCLEVVGAPLWHAIRSASRIPDPGYAGMALRVADLGCATGDNTVRTVEKLVENLAAQWESKGGRQRPGQLFPQDIEVFFADLASNDFNTLFRRLAQNGSGSRRYFAAGVPGSFFGQLFPVRSMHAITCFSALHWLSGIPLEVVDKHSPACNFDWVHVRGADPAVDRAFANQSYRDLAAFFHQRYMELVPGGFLAVAMGAKPDEGPHQAQLLDLFWNTFHELAVEGVIPWALIETFNIPIYFPSIAQIRRAVEEVRLVDIHVLRSCDDVSYYPPQTCEEYRADLRAKPETTIYSAECAVFIRIQLENHLGSLS